MCALYDVLTPSLTAVQQQAVTIVAASAHYKETSKNKNNLHRISLQGDSGSDGGARMGTSLGLSRIAQLQERVKSLEAQLKESRAAEQIAKQRQAVALETARTTARSRAGALKEADEAKKHAIASGSTSSSRQILLNSHAPPCTL